MVSTHRSEVVVGSVVVNSAVAAADVDVSVAVAVA